MQPFKFTVLNLFERPRRYVVPLYQRQYVWTSEDQWEPLWGDIRRKADAVFQRSQHGSSAAVPTNHFLGAVVLSSIPTFGREMAAYDVIDGQQRLTTLQIFLAALRDVAARADDAELSATLESLTTNTGLMANETERFKVWPTNADRVAFERVMTARSAEEVKARFPERTAGKRALPRERLAEAYLYFASAIEQYVVVGAAAPSETSHVSGPEENPNQMPCDGDKLFALFQAIRDHLLVVHIELEDGDDPQVIFETLNARGVPLLPSDLVRNFVFLHAARQKKDTDSLYRAYWQAYDEEPAGADAASDQKFWKLLERQGRLERPRLDLFLFYYLTYRTQRDIGIGHLFQEFRDWLQLERADSPIETELDALKEHAAVFHRLFLPDQRTRLGQFARRLRSLDTSTVYPVLLYLLGDEHTGLSEQELNGVVTDLESFLVRRMVAGLTNKNYNQLFLSLLKALRASPRPAREVVQEFLLSGDGPSNKWPTNSEFFRELVGAPLYLRLKGAKVAMILEALNHDMYTERQEVLPIGGKLEVEHILPQSYSVSDYPWPVSGAGDAEQYALNRGQLIHSLGNLTLLTRKLNASVSNGPFSAKRPEIAGQSTLRMNAYFQGLTNADPWTENAIILRSMELAERAVRIWPNPGPSA